MPETSMGIPYPSSVDPPNGPSQMQALAAAVNTLLELPDDVEAHVANVISITATSFATLPSPGPCSVSMTNPSSDYDLLVDMTFQAWVAPVGASNMTVGVAGSGGMTWAANGFTTTGNGPVGNSDNIFSSISGTGMQMGGYPILIPAGAAAVTFTMQAFRGSTGGTPAVNYPVIRVKPRRFVVP